VGGRQKTANKENLGEGQESGCEKGQGGAIVKKTKMNKKRGQTGGGWQRHPWTAQKIYEKNKRGTISKPKG